MNGRAMIAGLLLLGLGLGACGGDDGGPQPPPGQSRSEFERNLEQAASLSAADFPRAGGRTMEEIAATIPVAAELGLATSEYTPGQNRLAFGMIDQQNRFIYGKTAVYLAPTPQSKARGPFLAPADSLIVEPPFRSRGTAADTSGIAAIYSARVPLPRPGRYAVLVVTKTGKSSVGGTATITTRRASAIPAPGDAAPRVATDTLAAAAGDVASIDTRVPPDDMHQSSFDDVVGTRPVALLFATPALCQTQVCGPVTDIALQLKNTYGDQMEFIHQEVYVDNKVDKGLREPLRRFGLQTEPWLFVIDRDGRVAARLEGSFGLDEFENAIKAGL